MASSDETVQKPARTRRRPGTTPEARENQLISLAVDAAEKQIRAGTASAQVITHFLKLGSSRERLEQVRLGMENQLLEAKREQIASMARQEEMYKEALLAMRTYSGQASPEPVEYDD